MNTLDFAFPWQVGCGGTEVPFSLKGRRYIYVWNQVERRHYYYSFSEDIFISDSDFQKLLGT